MTKGFILFILLFGLSHGNDLDQSYARANEYLTQEMYQDAANAYESILSLGMESSVLYYNLGNAYFRQHYFGHAIWAYEKALQLNPRHEDAQYNLDLANARIVDRIDAPDPGFVLVAYRKLKHGFTLNEFVFIGAIFLLLSVLIYGLKRVFGLDGGLTRKIGLFLTGFALLIHGVALDKYWSNSDHLSGILIGNGVEVYSGPFEREESIVFRMNEGTKVDITSWDGPWLEILLLDGKKGWIPEGTIRKL